MSVGSVTAYNGIPSIGSICFQKTKNTKTNKISSLLFWSTPQILARPGFPLVASSILKSRTPYPCSIE